MSAPSFTTVVEHQVNQMLATAKILDERGYIVHVWHCNREWPEEKAPFSSTTIMMRELVKHWRLAHRRSPVIIEVLCHPAIPPDDKAARLKSGRVFDYPFTFVMKIQRTLRLRPIVVALELMSRKRKARHLPFTGNGMFECTEVSGRYEFKGEGRQQFQAMLRVLHMPHHQEAMTKK